MRVNLVYSVFTIKTRKGTKCAHPQTQKYWTSQILLPGSMMMVFYALLLKKRPSQHWNRLKTQWKTF